MKTAAFALAIAILLQPAIAAAQTGDVKELRWAGDPEGGAPFVEAARASRRWSASTWRSRNSSPAVSAARRGSCSSVHIDRPVDPRGDADIGLSGIEDTPARRATLAVTVPYYEFREVLSVRDADAGRFRTLGILAGGRVATLGGTIAYEILLRAEREHGIAPVSYDDDVHPYTDLVLGRVDAVLLDNVLAERRQKSMAGFHHPAETVAIGHYVGVLAAANASAARRGRRRPARRHARRHARAHLPQMGGLERGSAAALRAGAGRRSRPAGLERGIDASDVAAAMSRWDAARRYLPSLLRASVVTLVLSCLAMGLAVVLGVLIASGRVYGGAAARVALVGYVELMRGTPMLLQLFVLYYGIAAAVRLPAFAAALLGLALNYAAYESEIYRGALEAVPADSSKRRARSG